MAGPGLEGSRQGGGRPDVPPHTWVGYSSRPATSTERCCARRTLPHSHTQHPHIQQHTPPCRPSMGWLRLGWGPLVYAKIPKHN